jgi:hypothetical protein
VTIPVPNPLVVNLVPTPCPGSVTLADGTPLPQRAVTKIETTDSVPSGTNVTVPTAKSSGAVPTTAHDDNVSAPVVAANTVSKWKDPGFLLGVLSFLTGLVTAIVDVLPSSGVIDWRATWPKLMLAVLGAAGAYIRTLMNTITR